MKSLAKRSIRADDNQGQLNFLDTSDTHGWLEGHIKEQNYGADWVRCMFILLPRRILMLSIRATSYLSLSI
jgi:2',3'-cyclic-nucleotide 2'-phosphodiesterase (5'-nucleotidase family)